MIGQLNPIYDLRRSTCDLSLNALVRKRSIYRESSETSSQSEIHPDILSVHKRLHKFERGSRLLELN